MNLSNHFLVAMPDMEDAFFSQSVVYICKHDEDGALGIAINKPSPITMDMIFSATGKNIPMRMQHDSVMMGGRCKSSEVMSCIPRSATGKAVSAFQTISR